jgi:hypothetical protein
MTETNNIPLPTDEEQPQEPITDLLVNMFVRQAGHRVQYDDLYRRRGLNPPAQGQWGNLNDPVVQAAIREAMAYAIEEVYEAIGLLKNKPWKQTFRATDPDEFYKEFADAWHFWLEANILAGMTPDIIAKYYFQIAESNDNRRAEGY